MIAGVLLRNRLGVSVAAATGAAALALAFGSASPKDDPVAAPAGSAPLADPYESRTGPVPGLR
jgi:hypothetical protein